MRCCIQLLALGLSLTGILGRRLNHLFQLATFSHLTNDVTTPNQLTIDPQLRKCRPVGILGQLGTYILIFEDINEGKALTAGHDGFNRTRRKTTLREPRRTFHVQQDGIVFDLFFDCVDYTHLETPLVNTCRTVPMSNSLPYNPPNHST